MILLALLVATSPSPAELIAEGELRWQAMALEKAAAAFEEARAQGTPAEQVTASVWLGVVRTELGDFPAANAAFIAALRMERGARLPALLVEPPPRTIGLFEAAKFTVDEENGLHPPPPSPPVVVEPTIELDPRDTVVKRIPEPEPPWLLVVAGVTAGSGLVLATTGLVVDAAAGPAVLDGGTPSFACYGAGAALLFAGAALGLAAAVTAP